MYTALIVEDEAFVRHGIRTMVDWQSVEIGAVYEASNGQEAYELYKRLHPDIIITDQKMPVMDGLTLIKTIREKDHDARTQFVIMSCLDEFALIQQAMNYGVAYYFLKVTATCDDIQNVLRRLTREMKEQASQQINNVVLQAEELLQGFQAGQLLTESQAHTILSAFNRNPDQPYAVVIFRVISSPSDAKTSEATQSSIEMIRRAIYGIVNEVPQLLHLSTKQYISLLSQEQWTSLAALKERLDPSAFSDTVQIAASMPVHSCEQLSFALSNALYALDECYFTGLDFCICNNPMSFKLSAEVEMRLLSLPGNFVHLPGRFLDIYETRVRTIIRRHYASRTEFTDALCGLAFWLSTQSDAICDLTNDLSADCTRQITQSNTLLQSLAAFEQFAVDGLSLSTFSQQMPKCIAVVLLYIHSNLERPLTLNEIAAQAHVNPSYLSSLFHKVMRVTIVNYINSLRIERAKMFLRNTDLPISRIVSLTGYSQDIYFYRMFKRIVHQTPNEYRAQYNQLKN